MSGLARGQALGAIAQILAALDKAYTGFSDVADAVEQGTITAKQQLDDFSHFDFDPRFKTRVISVPFAIGAVEDLWDTIKSALVNKMGQIIRDSQAVAQFLTHLPPSPPGEPILQRTALILSFVHAFNDELAGFIRDILDFTQTIDDIKHRIETLDDLFLSQSSTRTRGTFRYSKRSE